MTLKIQNGDYVTDGCGGLERVEGTQALLQRVLFRLKARRGQFPFLETLGSRLWQLGQVSSGQRQAVCGRSAGGRAGGAGRTCNDCGQRLRRCDADGRAHLGGGVAVRDSGDSIRGGQP